MATYQPIKCTDYDQYEAYCITRAKLNITLSNEQQLTGYAIDLMNIKSQGEFLIFVEVKPELTAEKSELRVRLDMIKNVAVI